MEPSTVLTRVRQLLDDTITEYLWCDDELVDFIAEGYRFFAKDTRTLFDMSTADVAVYSVTAGMISIPVSPLIISIQRAIHTTKDLELSLSNSNTMPITGIGTGEVRSIMADRETGKVHFYPIPAYDFTLTLQVCRYPLESFQLDGMANPLEYSDERIWRIIGYFAAHRAYLKDDVESQDLTKARTMMQMYQDGVLEYSTDHKRATRTVGTVSYGGY